MSVSGKSCIVTGAANGVGLAIARTFAEAGARVVMADIDEEHLEPVATGLIEDGNEVTAFVGDVRERLTIANLLSATIDAFDRIDILVNASRRVTYADPLELTPEDLTTLFDQNVGATLRLTQAVVRKFQRQAEEDEPSGSAGAIVNVSSIASQRTLPQMTGYSVATAALDQLTRSLAVALATENVRVNAVAIGSLMSASLRDAIGDLPELREEVIAATPAGRIGDAEEAAAAALFLASDQASFITGQVLTVDGGRSLIDSLRRPLH